MTHQQAVDKHSAERYLLDEMPELERFAFEEHFFSCEICAEDVRTGATMREGVKAGLLPEPTSRPQDLEAPGPRDLKTPGPQDPRTSRPRDLRTFLPWAVAAMLALAVGYQSMWVVPGLRSQVIGPSVLSPVTLRGASRGAEPTLSRPSDGALSLAVDLAGVAAGARLTYDLRAADGASVATGTAAAPPAGTPLLLLIPASALESTGTYVLSIGSGEAGSAPVEYRFTLQ
jgi:hypothetical protein